VSQVRSSLTLMQLFKASLAHSVVPRASGEPDHPTLVIMLTNRGTAPLPLVGWALEADVRGGDLALAGASSSSSSSSERRVCGAAFPLHDLPAGGYARMEWALPMLTWPAPLAVTLRLVRPHPHPPGSHPNADPPAGLCLPLGSTPLDVLDLGSPCPLVPGTATALRWLEQAGAAAQDWRAAALQALTTTTTGAAAAGAGDGLSRGGQVPGQGRGRCGRVGSASLRVRCPAGAVGDVGAVLGLGPAMPHQQGALALRGPGGAVAMLRLTPLGPAAGGSGTSSSSSSSSSALVPAQLTVASTDPALLALMRAACCARLARASAGGAEPGHALTAGGVDAQDVTALVRDLEALRREVQAARGSGNAAPASPQEVAAVGALMLRAEALYDRLREQAAGLVAWTVRPPP
jgi:hypothetical protein